MFNGNFELDGDTLKIVEEIGRHMPGGFFIYKAAYPEELIYANHAVFDIFGCKDLEEFKELTGYTFEGMLHPDDYAAISESIVQQIDTNDDNMDYVEYRIIRKDGAVRWVDDFGHFTETIDYGGVYYVFISDITEKHERVHAELQEAKRTEAENKRLIEEIESAAKLADLMGSVSSLLTNMPAMSFSKDAETGKYLACNQSFAEYAHKKSPDEVVGLTDYDIFDPETAAHFVEDDRKAMSMDSPYIFFEDVPDATGKPRNLQTTKLKFIDGSGRHCTLGMCVDVTEMTRIKSAEAEARIKQQELEEKIALQDKLLEQSNTLREALEAAEAASRSKTNFLSNMSHEIRTPITAILGMNELIRRETTDSNILEYANNIDAAGTSLLGIINDILDFSKIEAGRMDLINVEYGLRSLIFDLTNLIRFRIEEKGLLFQTEIDPRLPSALYGDELRIKQIITNLLSNAAKYTEKGTVTLICRLEKKDENFADIFISVEDTGIGIRDEEKDKLFSAFDRLDVIHTRGIEGTGLGLAITSQMLELMNSRLSVESTYGKGSTFSFTIRQKITDATEIGEFHPTQSAELQLRSAKKTVSFTAPDARVLIVDDTPLNLKVIVGLLKRTRVQVDTAASGNECVQKFENGYDMVFLDYRMPDMDGIETLKTLYEHYPKQAKNTPIICLTASAVAGYREKMLEAGFDDYLAKPVNIAEMEMMMMEYLPKELVQISESSDENFDDAELKRLPSILFDIPEIDPVSGIEFCGDAEDYLDAVDIFSQSIASKAEKIENALLANDFETYTLLVHSLKSTSRAIGAQGVSDFALTLEQAGKKRDLAFMQQKTPEFLSVYRGLEMPLKRVFAEGVA